MNKNKIIISGIIAFLLLLGIAGAILLFIFVHILWPLIIGLVVVLLLEIGFSFRIVVSPRNPYAKASWMITILVLPVIGMFIFIIFGVYPLKKRQRKAYLEQQHLVLDKENFHFSQQVMEDDKLSWIFNYGIKHQYKPVSKDNDIRIIKDNTELFEESIKLIRSAKSYINVQSYIFSYNGFWSKIFFTELIKKANEGVKVRLIYDWLGAYHRINNKIFNELTEYGVEVACFNPRGLTKFKGSTNYRLHSKFLIVDNKVALYGGSNFADEYLSMNRKSSHWKDLNFIVKGPIVNTMNVTFVNYWTVFCKTKDTKSSRQNLLNDSEIIFQQQKFDESNVYSQLLVFEPDFNEFALENALLHIIFNAKKSIKIITPYFMPPNSVLEALKTAHKNGIKIELIGHSKNQPYVQMLNRENNKKLIDINIPVYEYDGYLHAKCLIIDDEYVLTGSCNVDWRSIYLDFESEMVVYNKEFTKQIIEFYNETKENSTLQTSQIIQKKLTPLWRLALKIDFARTLL